MELGHFDEHFIKLKAKKGTAGKNFGVFSENYILNGKRNPRKDIIGAFFSKIRALFSNFRKRAGETSPHPF